MTQKKDVLLRDQRVLRHLAKYMALHCFRNTYLEDLHAGTSPSSTTGDFTDVVVRTPHGEIPWNNLSRLSDDEMKRLMIEVVDHCFVFLRQLVSGRDTLQLLSLLSDHDPVPSWYDPPASEHVEKHHIDDDVVVETMLEDLADRLLGRSDRENYFGLLALLRRAADLSKSELIDVLSALNLEAPMTKWECLVAIASVQDRSHAEASVKAKRV